MHEQTNFFFNNFSSANEQKLMQNMIDEAISMYGIDTYYMPKTLTNYDPVYGADDQIQYTIAYPIVVYLESIYKFEGAGDFIQNIAGGLTIDDSITLCISTRVFNDQVTSKANILRPNEGDLIYFPFNKKLFQITYTDKFEMFFQLGKLMTYKVRCKLFQYSNEKIDTGITDIDRIQTLLSTNVFDWGVLDEDGYYLTDEDGNYLMIENSAASDLIPSDNSVDVQTESDVFVDFTKVDPFSEGNI